jgi:hypothetical protein
MKRILWCVCGALTLTWFLAASARADRLKLLVPDVEEDVKLDQKLDDLDIDDDWVKGAGKCGDPAAGICGCMPRWTVRAGAVLMERSKPDSLVLVTDAFVPGGNVLLNANEFNFDFQLGYEISAIRHGLRGTAWDLEARLLSIDGWNADRGAILSPAGAVAQFATPIGNTFFPSSVAGSYSSELHSIEINLRRQTRDWLTALAGFRYVELNENGLAVLQDIGPGLNLVNYGIGADNHLWGFQLGADALLLQRGRFSLEAVGKAGIYGNNCGNRVSITQQVGPSFASNAGDNHTAFVGELGAAGLFALNSHLALRVTYQLMWVDGVALASDQAAVSDPAFGLATVDTGATAFYHGSFMGLEYKR